MKKIPNKVKNPYFAGTILGFVLFAAFALTHSGLGASGAISRIQVALTKLVQHMLIVSVLLLLWEQVTEMPWITPAFFS